MKRNLLIALLLSLVASVSAGTSAQAQEQPFLGQVMWSGFGYCPQGWAEANGQLLPISQNTALFALLGTNFGGDGVRTFGLPNLQGRAAIGAGQGAGLTERPLGETVGHETFTLNTNQLPPHTHSLAAATGAPTQTDPGNNLLAGGGMYRSSASGIALLKPGSVGVTGGGAAVDNMPPSLALKACIAVQGIFPSRP